MYVVAMQPTFPGTGLNKIKVTGDPDKGSLRTRERRRHICINQPAADWTDATINKFIATGDAIKYFVESVEFSEPMEPIPLETSSVECHFRHSLHWEEFDLKKTYLTRPGAGSSPFDHENPYFQVTLEDGEECYFERHFHRTRCPAGCDATDPRGCTDAIKFFVSCDRAMTTDETNKLKRFCQCGCSGPKSWMRDMFNRGGFSNCLWDRHNYYMYPVEQFVMLSKTRDVHKEYMEATPEQRKKLDTLLPAASAKDHTLVLLPLARIFDGGPEAIMGAFVVAVMFLLWMRIGG